RSASFASVERARRAKRSHPSPTDDSAITERAKPARFSPCSTAKRRHGEQLACDRALRQVVRKSKLSAAIVTSALPSAAALRAAPAEPPSAATPDRAELALEIEPGVAGLDPAEIRTAIERELELPTVAATPSSAAVLSVRSLGEHRAALS